MTCPDCKDFGKLLIDGVWVNCPCQYLPAPPSGIDWEKESQLKMEMTA